MRMLLTNQFFCERRERIQDFMNDARHCRFGYLPKGSANDCFYYRLKLKPFVGDQAAEAVRQELLASFAHGVRSVVRCVAH